MFVERDITINGNWLDISDKAMFNRQYALLFFVVLNVSVFKVNECFFFAFCFMWKGEASFLSFVSCSSQSSSMQIKRSQLHYFVFLSRRNRASGMKYYIIKNILRTTEREGLE